MAGLALLGLSGYAGSGKDSVALVLARFGWATVSPSDALYEEVSQAFGVAPEYLRGRAWKEQPSSALALVRCTDRAFIERVLWRVFSGRWNALDAPCSPRQILQWWGTEYRRAQDPDYWVCRLEERVAHLEGDPRVAGVVCPSVRYANEVAWVRARGGAWWLIERPGCGPVNDHDSEWVPRADEVDRVICNNGSLGCLHHRVVQALNRMDWRLWRAPVPRTRA